MTLILHGGDGSFLGAPFTVLGIEKAQKLLREMPPTPRTAQLLDFVHDARLALANTNDALSATAHPIELVRRRRAGGRWALSAQVQAYALALTITFLALLLAAGALAAERDENVIGRLARGLVGLGQLVWSKVALAAVVALALGLAIALAFGLIIEIGGVTGGEPWRGCRCSWSGSCSRAARSARSARCSARSRARRARPRSSRCSSCCRSSSSGWSRPRSCRRPAG